MPDTVNPHFFQFVVLKCNERLSNNSIFCVVLAIWICRCIAKAHLEMNRSTVITPMMSGIPHNHLLSSPRFAPVGCEGHHLGGQIWWAYFRKMEYLNPLGMLRSRLEDGEML